MTGHTLFTSESVSEGHPDKIADQISDGILDAYLEKDPHSRVACETFVTTGLVVIGGEITSKAIVDHAKIARDVIKRIGYADGDIGFDYRSCGVILTVGRQSPDIAMGVNEGQGIDAGQGAGDQGMMFGYACNETEEFMPASIQFSHNILRSLAAKRHSQDVPWLRPDAKSQVTVRYEDGRFAGIDTVVVSTQHAPNVEHAQVQEYVVEEVVKKVIPANLLKNCKYLINPTGRFEIGGPMGDAGLTGRKIIVDTYGGHGAHGGGAFSGKDPSKVDRSGAYAARFAAKNIVAAGLAEKCLVQVAYAIGVAKPVSINVQTYGTGRKSETELAKVVAERFPFAPKAITSELDLLRPIYSQTATYGHFGNPDLPWERVDPAMVN